MDLHSFSIMKDRSMSALKLCIKIDMYVHFSGEKVHSFDEIYIDKGKLCAKYLIHKKIVYS